MKYKIYRKDKYSDIIIPNDSFHSVRHKKSALNSAPMHLSSIAQVFTCRLTYTATPLTCCPSLLKYYFYRLYTEQPEQESIESEKEQVKLGLSTAETWEITRKLELVSSKIIEEMEGRINESKGFASEDTYGMDVEIRNKKTALHAIKNVNEVSLFTKV